MTPSSANSSAASTHSTGSNNSAMTTPYHYDIGLFEATGIELEYMIVDAATLDVMPICDDLVEAVNGAVEGEITPEGEDGPVAWSNELALHVVEFKTNGPARSRTSLPAMFERQVRRATGALGPMRARLMPGAMHPWMNPVDELKLWPHEANEFYEAFDRIFSCRGHGWANLQSTHINLPFGDDDEFRRLHAAIRTMLPLLPGLAASSPVMEGRLTGLMDTRLEAYRNNCTRIPSVTGFVVPEGVGNRDEYESIILSPIYRDIASLDPGNILRNEWVNARGCIARFQRGTIEIRVLDIQECPAADMAIVETIIGAVRNLAEERYSSTDDQNLLDTVMLHGVFLDVIRHGDGTVIECEALLQCLGVRERHISLRELWVLLVERIELPEVGIDSFMKLYRRSGCLARRIAAALDGDTSREALRAVYGQLCDCLESDRMFEI